MAIPKDIKKKISALQKEIVRHQDLYHKEDAPQISDEAYDSLVRDLVAFESKYPEIKKGSPLEKIGSAPIASFEKVTHKATQWSFDNVFSEEELLAWEKRIARYLEKEITLPKHIVYSAEHKIDGLKVVLEYEKGVLVRGITRGDGRVGENITHNIKVIQSIPKILSKPVTLVAIGEAWISHREFERINKERAKNGEPLFANARNAAAGSLRQLDPTVTAKRNLDSFFYDIDLIEDGVEAPKTQIDELVLLKHLGFKTNTHYKKCKDLQEVVTYYKKWVAQKDTLPYEVDGVALKVDDVSLQKILGYTAKAPRFGVAFKFPAQQVTTTVEDIVLQVGRTGVLTPVAHLRPVEVAGSVVARATLHNEDEIARLGVRIGDTVIIQKAGDVIPDIVSVLTALRTGDEKEFVFPEHVAGCGGDGRIERIPGQSAYRCVDRDSFELQKQKFYYFVSKKAFNIEGLGPQIIDRLLEEGLIAQYDDIFTLRAGDIQALPGFKEKSSENLINAISAGRNVTLPRFLIALSIDQVGEETAHDLAAHFGSLKKIKEADVSSLERVSGVGRIVAESIYTWFHNPVHSEMLTRLLKHVVIKSESVQKKGVFSGKVFVLTGSLKELSRDEAHEKIRISGGSVSSSVSKNTDYVVVGESPGTKYDKAVALGVETLSERAFIALMKS
ncbi:MAG: NAD-dependent DNA ligase LigA [Candidatus Paceibacterota bacterium]